MTDNYVPSAERAAALDELTPEIRDFVLYCKNCDWIGDLNAVHARSAQCPECLTAGVRVWLHSETPRPHA